MATDISMKLFINRSTNQVLFAEAQKDFVDFLFSLLAMPAGSVVRLLSKKSMVGSLGKLYGSLESLSDAYMQPNLDKELALNPNIVSPVVIEGTLLLQNQDSPSATDFYYRCPGAYNAIVKGYNACSGSNFTDVRATSCPSCKQKMTTPINYVSPTSVKQQTGASGGVGGYVKEMVPYMVMDDLVLTPMSSTSFLTLLNKFHITEVGLVEERVVHVRFEEGLNLLRASLHSNTVLTDVFLPKPVKMTTAKKNKKILKRKRS